MPAPIESVAVLGTGTMGAPMARNLARSGFEVRAWNRTRERAEALADAGVRSAESPAAAARGADVALLMVADGPAALSVLRGAEGALAALAPGAILLVMATIGIPALEEVALEADRADVVLVDAPVLGTRGPAEAGELVVVASGPPEERDRLTPVLGALGRRVLWVGPAGAGQRLKLVLNAWLLSSVAALADTLALAEALDVPPASFFDAIDGGPVGMPYARVKGEPMVARDYAPAFKLALACKDAQLVREAAARHAHPMPVTHAAGRLLQRAVELGHGEEDIAAVFEATARPRPGGG